MPRVFFVIAAFAVLAATQSSFASDSMDEAVGLASEPIPVVKRHYSLTDTEVSTIARALHDLPASTLIEVLGAPDLVTLADEGVQFRYDFGRPLMVSVQNGRITSVVTVVSINREEQERQTGVRDDDFVGLVGP
ncbi:MAG TPA: hypothetical protein VHR66_21080 [Gemmataceae bacterium]|nr:hypothetical protein [Gemmataceae bacterium]